VAEREGSESYRNLKAWQEAMRLAEMVYALANKLPSEERFGMIPQMQRAAVSIPSNTAEGSGRGSALDFGRFLKTARGSLMELETLMLLAERIRYLSSNDLKDFWPQAQLVGRLLNGLIRGLKTQRSKTIPGESEGG